MTPGRRRRRCATPSAAIRLIARLVGHALMQEAPQPPTQCWRRPEHRSAVSAQHLPGDRPYEQDPSTQPGPRAGRRPRPVLPTMLREVSSAHRSADRGAARQTYARPGSEPVLRPVLCRDGHVDRVDALHRLLRAHRRAGLALLAGLLVAMALYELSRRRRTRASRALGPTTTVQWRRHGLSANIGVRGRARRGASGVGARRWWCSRRVLAHRRDAEPSTA